MNWHRADAFGTPRMVADQGDFVITKEYIFGEYEYYLWHKKECIQGHLDYNALMETAERLHERVPA